MALSEWFSLVLFLFGVAKGLHIPRQAETSAGEGETAEVQNSTAIPADGIDCLDVKRKGSLISKIYVINPSEFNAFSTVCNMETEYGGWTVFLKSSQANNITRLKWNEYVFGYGRLDGDFWLGLEKIHWLTVRRTNTILRIEISDNDEMDYYEYKDFYIDGAAQNYKPHISLTEEDKRYLLETKNEIPSEEDLIPKADTNCIYGHQEGWWFRQCADGETPPGVLSSTKAVRMMLRASEDA